MDSLFASLTLRQQMGYFNSAYLRTNWQHHQKSLELDNEEETELFWKEVEGSLWESHRIGGRNFRRIFALGDQSREFQQQKLQKRKEKKLQLIFRKQFVEKISQRKEE